MKQNYSKPQLMVFSFEEDIITTSITSTEDVEQGIDFGATWGNK